MEQREKLIELLKLASLDPANDAMMGQHDAEYYADFLIENGVVVLPCKVGDTVYPMDRVFIGFHNATVTKIEFNKFTEPKLWIEYEYTSNIFGHITEKIRIDALGRSVFLTESEAKRALAKRKGGDE